MSGPLATRDATESDFDAIQLAVMETDRGRWFLSEFARRNRHADTETLLTSLQRIERTIAVQHEGAELDKFRLNVLEMSRAIARTRAEIAAIKPPETGGRILEASGELDSIVSATEQATSEILAAAEDIQEVAWTLREAGAAAEACDNLDQHAVGIYTACSFQDLTAQRTRKVTEILAFLEKRVNAMADIWQFDQGDAVATDRARDEPAASMSQADVDIVLVDRDASTDHRAAAADFSPLPEEVPLSPEDEAAFAEVVGASARLAPEAEDDVVELPAGEAIVHDGSAPESLLADPAGEDVSAMAPEAIAADQAIDDILFDRPPAAARPAAAGEPLQLLEGGVAAEEAAREAFAKARSGLTLSPEEAAAALDALKMMSVEDRTKLFS